MDGHWRTVYKTFIDQRKQKIIKELVKSFVPSSPPLVSKPPVVACVLVDELLRLESAEKIEAHFDLRKQVTCPNKKPTLCEKDYYYYHKTSRTLNSETFRRAGTRRRPARRDTR